MKAAKDVIYNFYIHRGSASTDTDDTATSSEDNADCLLCSVWEESVASVEDHVAKARDRQNEVDVAETEEGLDVNNTSHTTQVTLHTLVILLI